MSVLIYFPAHTLVVCCGSILVVGLVVNYLIIIWFFYHFDYLHKSHDVPRFCLFWGLSSSNLVDLSREVHRGFVRNTSNEAMAITHRTIQ